MYVLLENESSTKLLANKEWEGTQPAHPVSVKVSKIILSIPHVVRFNTKVIVIVFSFIAERQKFWNYSF